MLVKLECISKNISTETFEYGIEKNENKDKTDNHKVVYSKCL